MQYILETKNLTKTYQSGSSQLTVLDAVNIQIPTGSTAAIVGASGSGKTTLLGLCAGLDRATLGAVHLDGMDITDFSEGERAKLRRDSIGFIFQNFQLMPNLTAMENVAIPAELQGKNGAETNRRAVELLERVGLGSRMKHYPKQLSGGEQQRVAIARAFIHQPKILFADEPTGNLDEESSLLIEDMLFEINQELGTTLVLVTHDHELAQKTQHLIKLKGGKLVSV
jgi:putative ABC transport system ATP-binding protein